MKTIILAVTAFVFSLVANAQSTAIYYSPVSETVELGFGFNPQNHKFVLSVSSGRTNPLILPLT